MSIDRPTIALFFTGLFMSLWTYLVIVGTALTLFLLPRQWYWLIPNGVVILVVLSALRVVSDVRSESGRREARFSAKPKRWANGKDGETKTEASDGYVPLHPILSAHLRSWREQSPYAENGDFVFPSLKARGSVPLSASIFVADYLRPAAKKAGAHIENGQRFGLHNLRHSLSNWLVNKAKVEPKTVQGILRHARVQTTLDLYAQEDSDETLAAQGEYLTALGVGSCMVQ
jgi:integrase